jgi:hypothetical protein
MARDFDYENGTPPPSPGRKGHHPHRAKLIDFVAFRDGHRDSIAADVEALRKLDVIIDATVNDAKSLREFVSSEATRLLEAIGFLSPGSSDSKEATARDVIEARIAANRNSAETAKAARPQVEARVAVKREQLAQLEKREPELLAAARHEMIDCSSWGQEYVRRLQSLREIMELIWSAADLFQHKGASVGTWERINREIMRRSSHDSWSYEKIDVPNIKLPRPGLGALKVVPDERFTIGLPKENPWQAIAKQLLFAPAEKIPLPALAA